MVNERQEAYIEGLQDGVVLTKSAIQGAVQTLIKVLKEYLANTQSVDKQQLASFLWDESADKLILGGAAALQVEQEQHMVQALKMSIS